MRKILLAAIALAFAASVFFALYIKSTFTSFPSVAGMNESTYIMSEGFQQFFDTEERTLDELLELSDAVVIAKRMDEGEWVGRSIRTHLKVIKNIKGTLETGVTYYEPVELVPGYLFGVRGYLPMVEGREYLLFLQQVDDPSRSIEYYPLCADIGKIERGKHAELREYREYSYGEVKDDAVLMYDEEGFLLKPKERVETYNKIVDESDKRGLWE